MRNDVSKNHVSRQLVSRNRLNLLKSQLISTGIKYRYFLFDSQKDMLAIHCENMTSIGQLQKSTGMDWTAFKGNQKDIPFIKEAFEKGRPMERIVPFPLTNVEAATAQQEQEYQCPAKGTVKNTLSPNKTPEQEMTVNLASRIEELEANQKVLAMSLSKANEEICFLRTRISSTKDTSNYAEFDLSRKVFSDRATPPAVEWDNIHDVTLRSEEVSRVDDMVGGGDAALIPLTILAPGFRFATPMEVHSRLNLVGMHVLYLWPEMGWLKGKVIRLISRNGFTHVVQYSKSSTWKRGWVADTLLSTEQPDSSRWKLLLALDMQHR
jgi:hypothetical protein